MGTKRCCKQFVFVLIIFQGILLNVEVASWKLFVFRSDPPTFKDCKASELLLNCFQKNITKIEFGSTIQKGVLQVDLRLNAITKLSKGSFSNGVSVKELKLSFNSISYIGPHSFSNFKGLQLLFLEHNKLHKLDKDMLQGVSSLQSLYLGYNQIMSVDPAIFQPTQHLELLSLPGNPLVTLAATKSILTYIPNILNLDLSSTKIETIPSDFFKNDTKLKKLKLTNNKFVTLPTDALKVLENLQLLDISFNSIQNLSTRAFEGLENLKILVMDNMDELTVLREGVFDGLTNLQSLYCSYNEKLHTLHRWAFLGNKPVRRLREMFLNSNALTMLFEDTIAWQDMDKLDLRNNPWNCNCDIAWMSYLRTSKTMDDNFKCKEPKFLSGVPIKKVKVREFVCIDETSYTTILAVIFMSAIFVFITLTIFIFLAFRFKMCKRLRASQQAEYKVFSNKEVVEIKIDGEDIEKRIGVMYGAKEEEEVDKDSDGEDECYYSRVAPNESVA